jgi:hypothetical protein
MFDESEPAEPRPDRPDILDDPAETVSPESVSEREPRR